MSRIIRDVPLACGASDELRTWTHAIKAVLATIAQASDLTIFPNDRKGEFLVDFLLHKEGYGAVLAVESEWGTHISEIIEDFEKLIHVKAPYKLMIFNSARSDAKTEVIKAAFGSEMRKYSQYCSGEQYIFVEFKSGDSALSYTTIFECSREISSPVAFTNLIERTAFSRTAAAL